MSDALHDPRRTVAAAVKRVLDHEAKLNELRVAIVRVGGYSAVFGLDAAMAAFGLRPWSNVPQTGLLAGLSLVILVGLRRSRFRAWYKAALPLLDGVLLTLLLGARLKAQGPETELVATIALVCALYAITGALRFSRPSSIVTTASAFLLFMYLLGPHAAGPSLVYSAAAIAAIGLLAMWLADLVRRSMEGAGSRALLQRFLPRDLVESAFDDPLAVFAEARVLDATVLVSDLRGFTAMSERVPPDRVFAFLSDLQGDLARVVHSHGGVVDKFLGDGMLAVFGLDGRPDHAARSVAAARDIRRVVVRLNEKNLLGAPVRIGVGVHTGPLVAGCIGSGDRLESTIVGDTVNTASRLETMTKEHGVDVLLSEEVVARSAEADARPLGAVPVRGREQPLAIYALGA